MKLSLFNGGLNTRQSELLIAQNEAIEMENVDNSTGTIVSAKNLVDASIASANKPYFFDANDEWVDMSGADTYMEYQSLLYWSVVDGRAQKYDGTNTYNLGIVGPLEKPHAFAVAYPTADSSFTNTVIKSATLVGTFDGRFTILSYGYFSDSPEPYATYSKTYGFRSGVLVHFPFPIVNKQLSEISIDPGAPAPYRIYIRETFFLAPIYTLLNNDGAVGPTIITYDFFNRVTLSATVVLGAPAKSYSLYCVISTDPDYTTGAGEIVRSGSIAMDVLNVTRNNIAGQGILVNIAVSAGTVITHVYSEEDVTAYVQVPEGVELIIGTPPIVDTMPLDLLAVYNTLVEYDTHVYSPLPQTGEYNYLYTYYNILDGAESAPSQVSDLVVASFGRIFMAYEEVPTDTQISHRRIYKVGGTLLSFSLIAEIDVDADSPYEDNTAEADVTGEILSSELNGAPQDGLRFLRHVYGLFIGAIEDKFYFTRDIGNPNYWPETYYVNFESEITGLAIAGSGIIVFTRYKSYIIIGTNANTFVKYTLSEEQGCTNGHTIVEQGAQVLFMSTDGLCSTSGSDVQVISKHKLGKQNLDTVNATIYDETYYLQLSNNQILAFDYRYEPHLKHFNFGTDYLVVGEDTLYGRKDGILYEMFAGALVEYTYVTGRFTEGVASVLKAYKSIYVNAVGDHVLKVYIGNELILTQTLTGKTVYEVKLPQKKQQGYDIKFSLTGTGTVNELEYKAVPREQI